MPKERRTKLDDKAIPCIFLGYGNEEFGYRLWDPNTKKFIRSRDVIFHEDEIFDSEKKGVTKDSIRGISTIPSTTTNKEELVEMPPEIME